MSSKKPDLRVEVAPETSEEASSTGDTTATSSSVWSKYSPAGLLAKSSTQFKRLTTRKESKGAATPAPRTAGTRPSRTTVSPLARAAIDARAMSLRFLKERADSGGGGGDGTDVRIIFFDPQAEDMNTVDVTNRVVTHKYNIVTFLPIFLFEMFSRTAYLYFLIQVGTFHFFILIIVEEGKGAICRVSVVLLATV
jgi:hypothetical protein